MTELGLDPAPLGLVKYDENEPRVPAGNGIQSGRWGSVTGTFVIEDANATAPANVTTAAIAIPAAVARDVGGSIVFDPASLADVAPAVGSQAAAQARAKAETDSPQLCPDPGPDMPHGASARAIAYQAQISALNNPQRPLPPGVAVSLPNPATGRRVVYDDCRESDGTMIEAKGPGYAKLLKYSYFSRDILPYRWTSQAGRQVAASGGRDLHWFFAEESAAEKARKVFQKTDTLARIKVSTVPAIVK